MGDIEDSSGEPGEYAQAFCERQSPRIAHSRRTVDNVQRALTASPPLIMEPM
ncbi:MAG TPA: hypothetical protein VFB32_03515 [Rudaea sp.]|nr:hypothetical protein [Rudaea sp.]